MKTLTDIKQLLKKIQGFDKAYPLYLVDVKEDHLVVSSKVTKKGKVKNTQILYVSKTYASFVSDQFDRNKPDKPDILLLTNTEMEKGYLIYGKSPSMSGVFSQPNRTPSYHIDIDINTISSENIKEWTFSYSINENTFYFLKFWVDLKNTEQENDDDSDDKNVMNQMMQLLLSQNELSDKNTDEVKALLRNNADISYHQFIEMMTVDINKYLYQKYENTDMPEIDDFDFKKFTKAVSMSLSLTKKEKERVMEKIGELNEDQISELYKIFEEEMSKFDSIFQDLKDELNDDTSSSDTKPKKKQKKASAKKTEFVPTTYLKKLIETNNVKDLIEKMDRYIVGQTEAKRALSIGVLSHLRRSYLRISEGEKMEKNNILIVGPSGCGKTSLIKTMSKIIDVPFLKVDATSLSQTGYVGKDPSDIMIDLLKKTNFDLKKAQHSIVVIDEVDKLRSYDKNSHEVSNKEVQNELLNIVEGEEIYFNTQKQSNMELPDKIDVSNILFICLGSFDGISRIIRKRLNKNKLGFSLSDTENLDGDAVLEYAIPQDFIDFGMTPELVGRLSIISHVKSLDKTDLRQILTSIDNSPIDQLKREFELTGIDLEFEEQALDLISERLEKKKTGARQIQSELTNLMLPHYLNLHESSKKISINKDYVAQQMK